MDTIDNMYNLLWKSRRWSFSQQQKKTKTKQRKQKLSNVLIARSAVETVLLKPAHFKELKTHRCLPDDHLQKSTSEFSLRVDYKDR